MKIAKKRSLQSLDRAYIDAIQQREDGLHTTAHEETESLPQVAQATTPSPDTRHAVNLPSDEAPPENITDQALHLKLVVAPDAMSVTLKINGNAAISTYELRRALTELGVRHGIDKKKLQAAEQISQRQGIAEVVVAKGTPPDIKKTVKFIAVNKMEVNSELIWMVDGIQIDFDHLIKLYEQKDLGKLDKHVPKVKAVRPGEIIVQIEDNHNAKNGMDIFGINIEPEEAVLPVMGDNIRFNPETTAFESIIFGYLLVDADELSVLPPLWITKDQMKAYYICLPQIPPHKIPTSKNLKILLILARFVEQCKRKKVIDLMCQKLAKGQELKTRYVLIAESQPPIPGEDATISLCFDDEKKAGTLRHDGSIDLRERNIALNIREGSKIAIKTKTIKGIDGYNIFGKKIKAKVGNDLNIITDKQIRVEENETTLVYFAKKSGNVTFKNNQLTITDIYKIDGDVDYNSGNIDVNTDLLITGSVLSGFKVKAQGFINIEGAIYNGATIFTEGDMIVGKGIHGKDTTVIVLGDLNVPFIQDAEVIVKGKTIIDSYLYNSILRTNHSISIMKAQGRKSGRAVGGVTCSSTKINLSIAGNVSYMHTFLAIQADPEIYHKLEILKENRQSCQQSISKITRTLPFDNFTPAIIKDKLAKLSTNQHDIIINLLTNLNKLIKRQKVLTTKHQEIKRQIGHSLDKASIHITTKIFKGCEIQIGNQKLLLNEDLGPTIFQLKNGKLTY